MSENELSSIIIGVAIEVHTQLGPGLLESVYETCLYYELKQLGLKVERQVELPVKYKNLCLDSGLRLDLIVQDKVIIELKAVRELCDIHVAQTLTYLKLTDLRLGLLINFNEVRLKNGLRRIVNNMAKSN
ncbi:GxxExxY protein [Fluviicola sp.]|uniref:GxxExxY protein n=1 Tax=Fluviicola sp. TaxID=1917219 RepID=UPI0031E20793